MKKEQISELLAIFEDARTDLDGTECWSARDLQEVLGYAKWDNFQKIIEKAKEACSNVGENWENHFLTVSRKVDLAKKAVREIRDIALTR